MQGNAISAFIRTEKVKIAVGAALTAAVAATGIILYRKLKHEEKIERDLAERIRRRKEFYIRKNKEQYELDSLNKGVLEDFDNLDDSYTFDDMIREMYAAAKEEGDTKANA